MDENIKHGVGGFIGVLIGVVSSWFGLKAKINGVSNRVDRIANSVIYRDTFEATIKPIEARLSRIEEKLDEILLTIWRRE